MKRGKLILLLGLIVCLCAGCGKSGETAAVHYTMPPDKPWEEMEWYDEMEWHEKNCDNKIELISMGINDFQSAIQYEALEDKGKIRGWGGEFIFYLNSDKLTKSEILRTGKLFFTVMTEENKVNCVQYEIVAKEKKGNSIKQHFWLRYADKHRKKMVIYIAGEDGGEGTYMTDEEWLGGGK